MMSARVSAKTGEGVHDMFKHLMIAIHDKRIAAHREEAANAFQPAQSLTENKDWGKSGKSGCC